MTEDQKQWIDDASYETLLSRWRHAPSGDDFFEGHCGTYYTIIMGKKKKELGDKKAVEASKRVGW